MDTITVQIVKFDPFSYKIDDYIKIVNDLDDNLPIEFSVLFSSGYKPLTGRNWTKEKILDFINRYMRLFKVDYSP